MIVSKGEFARMVGRSPSAVSAWISEGKLTAPALQGEGHRAKIDYGRAVEQLRGTLDIGQQLAHKQPLFSAEPVRPSAPPANEDASRLMRAKADREELELRMANARAEEMAGRWMRTSEAREVWAAELAGLLQAFDTWLITTAARQVATLDSRDDPRAIGKVLRDGFRELKLRIAEKKIANGPAPDLAGDDEEAPDGVGT